MRRYLGTFTGLLCCNLLMLSVTTAAEIRSSSHKDAANSPADVDVGIYLLRIPSWDLRTTQISIDAYIWFRAKETVNPKPWETFEITNGTIEHKEVCDQKSFTQGKDGKKEAYSWACLRIQATLTQLWDLSRFPLDRHTLVIAIEDSKRDERLLRYHPDSDPCRIDENVSISGWTFGRPTVTSTSHHYQTTYGDPDLSSGGGTTFSRWVVEIPVNRTSVVYALKVLTALYVAVCIAFLAFFVKPHNAEVRFVIGTSAIFASVASQYVIAASLPDSSQLTLVEKLHIVGHATILVSLVISVVSLWLQERERHRAAWLLDRGIGVLVIVAYLALNVWLIAQPHWPYT